MEKSVTLLLYINIKNNKLMEDIDNYYNEHDDDKSIPNDGREEIDISPIDLDDM